MRDANKTKTLLVEKTKASHHRTSGLKKSENNHKTEFKKVLRKPETYYWSTLDKVLEGCQVIGFDFRYLYLNDAVAAHGRRTKEELLGHTMMEMYAGIENTEMFAQLRRCIEKRTSHRMVNEFTFLDGTRGWFELCMEPVPEGALILSWDITENKEAKDILEESEQNFRTLAEESPNMVFINKMGPIVYANRRCEEITGYKREELYSSDFDFLTLIAPEYKEQVKANFSCHIRGQESKSIEYVFITKYGKRIEAILNTKLITYKKRPAILGVMTDISQHKKVEQELKLRAELLDCTTDSIFAHDLEGNFIYVNETACQFHGYSKEEFMKKKLQQVVTPERVNGLADDFQMMLDNGQAIFESAHLLKDGSVVPVEVHGRTLEYGGKEILLTVIRNITDRKQAEEELRKSYAKLQKTVEGAIEAIGTIAETRDPYTAGHQRRVAKLASAIAEEMNLPPKKIETIHVAGILHDIGKINVPAEILSKPSKLSDVEMNLVKTHPQIGREILKSLELPWPICQIVLQHHERADGSGYPNGISGDNITIEARILAVADVVEAMASHRPYRPSLGIDKALEEISKNTGIFYDPNVVSACLKVFQEKGFKFE